jgi:cation diffusion facilitator family transporter
LYRSEERVASGSKKVIYAALLGNALIAITKFVAATITGSSAMLSEGIHSAVDTGNQLLLLHGLRQARKPADRLFPFGHGKEIYFWSFVVAILIFAVGAGVSIYEGIRHLLHPQTITDPLINYVVLGFALVFEGAAWSFALIEFRKEKGQWGYVEAVQRGKDPTLFVVLFEDTAAMVGLLVAAAGIGLAQVTGIAYFDGAASIVIGLILGATAMWLAYETKGLLIGESANIRVVDGIRALALAEAEVQQVNEVLSMHMGPDNVLLNLSVKFRDQATALNIEAAVRRMEAAIKSGYPEVQRIFIEAESRNPQQA